MTRLCSAPLGGGGGFALTGAMCLLPPGLISLVARPVHLYL